MAKCNASGTLLHQVSLGSVESGELFEVPWDGSANSGGLTRPVTARQILLLHGRFHNRAAVLQTAVQHGPGKRVTKDLGP